jgi:hypothetical protein
MMKIKDLAGDMRSMLWYSCTIAALLIFFTYSAFTGTKYFPDGNIQKNANYRGVVPHSGYGVRFYHK